MINPVVKSMFIFILKWIIKHEQHHDDAFHRRGPTKAELDATYCLEVLNEE